ncbi:MAG: LytR C-terminal domain-containing protein [Candidatus Cloacimonadia bacterium]
MKKRTHNKFYTLSTTSLMWIKISLIVLIFALLGACQKSGEEEKDLLPAVKVRILNGCGISGVASEFSDFLTKHNVDVIGVGNSRKFIYDKTIIIVKRDDEQDLNRLIKYTGITRRAFAVENDSEEDFQIIIGRDYQNYIKK